MDAFTNEQILYGGIILAAASIVLWLVYMLIRRARKRKLERKFDEEYGARPL